MHSTIHYVIWSATWITISIDAGAFVHEIRSANLTKQIALKTRNAEYKSNGYTLHVIWYQIECITMKFRLRTCLNSLDSVERTYRYITLYICTHIGKWGFGTLLNVQTKCKIDLFAVSKLVFQYRFAIEKWHSMEWNVKKQMTNQKHALNTKEPHGNCRCTFRWNRQCNWNGELAAPSVNNAPNQRWTGMPIRAPLIESNVYRLRWQYTNTHSYTRATNAYTQLSVLTIWKCRKQIGLETLTEWPINIETIHTYHHTHSAFCFEFSF